MAQIIQFSTHPLCAEKNHGGTSKEGPPPPANPADKARRSPQCHGASAHKAQIIELRPVTLEELLDRVEQGNKADVIGNLLLTSDEAAELLRGDLEKRAHARRSNRRPRTRAPRLNRASGTR